MPKITYEDKENLILIPNIQEINKITATDMNSIKNVVNSNYDELTELSEYCESIDVPIGHIALFSNDVDNYIICDGRELSRDQYRSLYNIIGTKYGEGNGSTTFNIPNQYASKDINFTSDELRALDTSKNKYYIKATKG